MPSLGYEWYRCEATVLGARNIRSAISALASPRPTSKTISRCCAVSESRAPGRAWPGRRGHTAGSQLRRLGLPCRGQQDGLAHAGVTQQDQEPALFGGRIHEPAQPGQLAVPADQLAARGQLHDGQDEVFDRVCQLISAGEYRDTYGRVERGSAEYAVARDGGGLVRLLPLPLASPEAVAEAENVVGSRCPVCCAGFTWKRETEDSARTPGSWAPRRHIRRQLARSGPVAPRIPG
jgi:hypothetical protein